MWFLAGTFGGHLQRSCTVAAGLPLVAPVINLFGDHRIDCLDFMADATGTVEFDGKDVPLQRIDHEPVRFTAGPGNPVTGGSGETLATGCGIWARIDPPSAGEHTVRIHGTSGTTTVDAEYTLLVAAASQAAT